MLYEKLSAASVEEVSSERHSHKIEMTKLPAAYRHRAAYTHTHTATARERRKRSVEAQLQQSGAWIDK